MMLLMTQDINKLRYTSSNKYLHPASYIFIFLQMLKYYFFTLTYKLELTKQLKSKIQVGFPSSHFLVVVNFVSL